MAIPASQVRALFTQKLIDVYQERIRPTAFLRGFFPAVTEPTRYVEIEVERMGEKIAVDVVRGTEGNRNVFARSTQKIFEPPMYREYFDATHLDLYDRVLGSQDGANGRLFARLLNTIADKLGSLQDKIERSIELQCAQVLLDGIVQTSLGNIDYKRKAGSLVDGNANYFETGSMNPFPVFEAAGVFLRTYGKSTDGHFNVILGATAFSQLLLNSKFQTRQNLFHMKLDDVTGPARNGTGAVFHGRISSDNYTFDLWTYPQIYEDANGANQPYIHNQKMVVIPSSPRFKTAFAAVPQLIGEEGQVPVQAPFVLGNFRDKRNATHEFDIQSAPLAIPVAVDQIYTAKVTGIGG